MRSLPDASSFLRLSRPGMVVESGACAVIEVDGRAVTALQGESLAAALAAFGQVQLRGTPGQSPGVPPERRGLYCGMGVCFECRVTVDGRPGQRACMTTVRAGMQVQTCDPDPSMRAPEAPAPQFRTEDCDVLVIGAGPAGLAAAEAVAQSGASAGLRVVILDERASPGGQYFKPLASSHRFEGHPSPDAQFAEGMQRVERVRALGVQVVSGAQTWDAQALADGGVEVRALDAGGAAAWRAKKLVIAAGAHEVAWPVPGWTLPGVMTTGAAQTLSRAYRVGPGRRVLFAGNGPLNLQVAADLARDGLDVVAVAEAAGSPFKACVFSLLALWRTRPDLTWRGLGYLRTLRWHAVPVLHRHVLVRVEGQERAERAVLAAINEQGAVVPGSERAFEVDAVCLGYGFSPSGELSRLLGCAQAIDPRNGRSQVTVRDADGRSSIRDVFVAGDAGGPWGSQAALRQGTLAGLAIAADLGFAPAIASAAELARRGLAREQAFQSALWKVFSMPDTGDRLASDDTLACRCESVDFGTVRRAIAEGEHSLAGLKRATRCGMGACQGRYCSPVIAGMLARHTGSPVTPQTYFRTQAPVRPVPIDALAAPMEGPGPATLPASMQVPASAPHAAREAPVCSIDTLVIGGGVIGLSVARELARFGREVVVLERGEAHAEASGVNAGSLHVQFQTFSFPDLDAPAALNAAATLALQRDSVYLWDELSHAVERDLEVAIEGGLTVADDTASLAHLERKVAIERAAGLSMDIISGDEARRLAPCLSERIIAASYSRDEGKMNPMLAAPAMRAAALATGAQLHTHTAVQSIERAGSGDGFLVHTSRGTYAARRVVNAAGAWAGQVAALAGDAIPVQPNPIQMLVTEALPALLPYHLAHATRRLTLKQAAAGNLVIGGGWKAVYDPVAARMRPAPAGFSGNLSVVKELLPGLGAVQLIRSWTGIAFTTPPLVGPSAKVPGLYHAITQNGMTLGPAIGRMTAGMILGRAPEYDLSAFAPARLG